MNNKNVMLICTDHWLGALMGCAGHDTIMTPTLDSLAASGIRFDNYYSECPVCIPARRTMMTGLLPKHHGDRVYSEKKPMPNAPTMAQIFKNAGYRAFGVGKLHVYPQRDRIGFDDVILQEEGRYEFGAVDDYQIWLGEHGFTGMEFMHGMGNNTYYSRPWSLHEYAHPTAWATKEMARQIKRKDPTKPAFYYLSYQFPHPPLVPLQVYLDMYKDEEIDLPEYGDWENDAPVFELLQKEARQYSKKEIICAKRAFYAQCTHIDNQIRVIIGTLRECNLLDNTIIIFTSDHGDMLFDHHMVAKRKFYQNSACVPLIISGKPFYEKYGCSGSVSSKLGGQADLLPTLLDICGIEPPSGLDGTSLMSKNEHEYIYGEVGENEKASRMIRKGDFKLIYYPYGNTVQLFNIKDDPKENHNLSQNDDMKEVTEELLSHLLSEMYGSDMQWITDGVLTGITAKMQNDTPDFGLYNQRGYHWPPPDGYCNKGKNA